MSNPPTNDDRFVERRKFKRAYFSSDDEVTGLIVIPDSVIPPISGNISHLSIGADIEAPDIDGNISNLSLGGLYLILKKSKVLDLKVDDTLTLKEVQATILYNLELNADMQIRRLHNYEFVGRIGLGCEFIGLSEHARETIGQLVEWGLSRNGEKQG